MSKKLSFDAMSIDEMWQLHEEISRVLSVRLTSEKRELEKRLVRLRREKEKPQPKSVDKQLKNAPRQGRKYPKVFPKYRNTAFAVTGISGRPKSKRLSAHSANNIHHALSRHGIYWSSLRGVPPRGQHSGAPSDFDAGI